MNNSYSLLTLSKAGTRVRTNSCVKPIRLSCRIVSLHWFFSFVHFLQNSQPISLERKRVDKFLSQISRGADSCVTVWREAGHQTMLQVPKMCSIFKIIDGTHAGAKCLRAISIMLTFSFFLLVKPAYLLPFITNPWHFQVPRHKWNKSENAPV